MTDAVHPAGAGPLPTASALAAGFADGSADPVAAAERSLAAVAAHDPAVNAMTQVFAEEALEAARVSADRWASGRPLSPVDGVPVTVKDLFLTRGRPTLRGSTLVDPAGPWDEDAPAVARLQESGAVVLGKTTTPEFAWKGVTDSVLAGSTGNPWGAHLTAGGSSGGSAAAVGLGMGAWSIGTDGGGSVRIPAAFTGTVAIKPTFGLVPIHPPSPYGTLSHAGPMTRTVRDAALLLDVLTGFDARDWFALPRPTGSFLDGLDDGVAGLRVAFSPTLAGTGVNDPEVEAAVRAAVEVLAGLGAEVEEVDPEVGEVRDAFETLWFTGAGKVVEPYGADALDRIDPLLAEHVRRHAGDTASDYLGAVDIRMRLGATMGRFHERYDLLLTPTMPIAAFARDRDAPAGWPEDLWTSWTPYTYPFNLTGQPALSVPCGFTGAGLPVGLQVVGARHADRLVLRAGHAYEAATDWSARTPSVLGP
ncbi:amidase [Phycicoccus flavus]|uniref:Amidase n=1 Tax=Phycicoccus flavus TaxID=2502783 RepID=A0A8T6QYL8_9MICO|nr:amidase [Phycicoccus flavus]NHA66566.1 amidase [Phycicoccus flavus]